MWLEKWNGEKGRDGRRKVRQSMKRKGMEEKGIKRRKEGQEKNVR